LERGILEIFHGLRVLVVEDSPPIAELTCDLLRELGCIVIGPAGTMTAALDLAQQEEIDAAMIDINIRGSKVFPVAEILAQRDIPFLFTSGYAGGSAPEKWKNHPRLDKPYGDQDVRRELRKLVEP
jgi:CheY-like chemotaxis protein